MPSTFSKDAHGNTVARRFVGGDRSPYDLQHCTAADGWRPYPTAQDAAWFGVWVHDERRRVVTFAEGDETRTLCRDAATFVAELARMADFYARPRVLRVSLTISAAIIRRAGEREGQG